MTVLTFVTPSGERRDFAADTPSTAVNVAQLNGVSGIEAECGGALSCGTCHVYVDAADMDKLPAASADEEEMLELVAAERRDTSRLCCQIKLDGSIGALTLHLPETQF